MARWHRATFEQKAMREEGLAEMAAHPRFGEACVAQIHDGLAWYGMNRMMADAAKDAARFFLGYLTLYLHARDGITLTAIQQFCKDAGIISAGRAAAILIRMRMIGFIEFDPHQTDRRTKRYRPTAAMAAGFRTAIRSELLSLAIVEPDAAAVADRIDDPAIFRAYAVGIGEGLIAVLHTAPRGPIAYFAQRNTGMMILNTILISGTDTHIFPPKEPIPVSLAALAARFKVSRTHVLRLMRGAEKRGYLTRDEEQRTITLTEPLRQDIVKYNAGLLIGRAICAHRALLDVEMYRTRAVAE